MIKELSFPAVFSAPRTRIIRASNLKGASFGRKVAVWALMALNAVLLFSYILGVNNYASTGYEIKALQNKISALTQENRKSTLEISERVSVANLETELSRRGFAPIKAAKFLTGESQYSQR